MRAGFWQLAAREVKRADAAVFKPDTFQIVLQNLQRSESNRSPKTAMPHNLNHR